MIATKTNEFRAEIEGYGAVFNVPDLSGDIIRPGAFIGFSEKDIPVSEVRATMLYQHTVEKPIGRWTHLSEDDHGLFVRGELFLDTSDGERVHRLLRGGAIDGLSIGFRSSKSRRLRSGFRELLSIDLWEVSVVTFPMAPSARLTRVGDPGEKLPQNLLR